MVSSYETKLDNHYVFLSYIFEKLKTMAFPKFSTVT